MKCSFLDYIHFLIIGWAIQAMKVNWNVTKGPLSHWTLKCSFLDYVQLLMIGRAGRWTLTPSATTLQSKKWNACFWIMFNFWWSVGLVNGLEPHLPPFSSQKIKCLFLDYIQLLMIGRAGRWTRTPSATPLQPKKIKCSFLDYIQLLMIGWAGRWTRTPSATPLQPIK